MSDKKPKYEDNSDVTINGSPCRITECSPVRQGDGIVDFIYELDARRLRQATEGEMDRLISGELTLKKLEESNSHLVGDH